MFQDKTQAAAVGFVKLLPGNSNKQRKASPQCTLKMRHPLMPRLRIQGPLGSY
jgi:hypothetical protein